jgi:superfamily I DNA/RNA helicase
VTDLQRDLRDRRALRRQLGAAVGACDLVGTPSRERAPPSTGNAAPRGSLTLATFHGTKGLEWDHVACVGHDEGIFPAARALRESREPERVLEEERRLAYVAWTRARRSLTIVYDPGAPSRFLREAFDREELA